MFLRVVVVVVVVNLTSKTMDKNTYFFLEIYAEEFLLKGN